MEVSEAKNIGADELEAQRISSLRSLQADNCIKNHVIAAMGVGLIPSFMVEVVGVAGIEVKMIRDLALVYDFPVPLKLVAYKILISVFSSIAPLYIAIQMRSVVKGVPLIGHAAYISLLSVSNGAAVYAVGKIFEKHYASGGTFLGGSKSSVKQYFKDQYEDGKKVVPVLVTEARS
ncbi:MAG: DUF697 domain-containing protein [Gallionellaceae bacterium]